MRLSLSLILMLFIVSILYSQSQKFNIFKSYADAKVKPANYGKVIEKDHPVTEYLDQKQLKMLRERNSADTPSNTFDNSWSGFKDRSVLTEIKKGGKKNGRKKEKRNRSRAYAEGDVGEDLQEGSERRKLVWDDIFRSATALASPPTSSASSSPSASAAATASISSLLASYGLEFPVLLEGNANQNLFYVVLFGTILSGILAVTLYFLCKNIYVLLWSKRSTSHGLPLSLGSSSGSIHHCSNNNHTNNTNQHNGKRIKCSNGVCEIEV